jgi:hypothetical protein
MSRLRCEAAGLPSSGSTLNGAKLTAARKSISIALAVAPDALKASSLALIWPVVIAYRTLLGRNIVAKSIDSGLYLIRRFLDVGRFEKHIYANFPKEGRAINGSTLPV